MTEKTSTAAAAASQPGSSEIAAALGIPTTGTTGSNTTFTVTPTVPVVAKVEQTGGDGQEPPADGEESESQSLDSLPEWAQKQIRSLRREDRAYRAKASQYDELVKSQMTEQERAVTEAKAAGRGEAQTEYGQRLAAAEIKAALTGIVETPDDVIEDLNLTRYVTDEGEVDTDAVETLRAKYASMLGGNGKPRAKPISHGRQNTAQPASSKDQFADTVSALFN